MRWRSIARRDRRPSCQTDRDRRVRRRRSSYTARPRTSRAATARRTRQDGRCREQSEMLLAGHALVVSLRRFGWRGLADSPRSDGRRDNAFSELDQVGDIKRLQHDAGEAEFLDAMLETLSRVSQDDDRQMWPAQMQP